MLTPALLARNIERMLLLFATAAISGNAYALKSDREKPIHASADHETAFLGNAGKATLSGHVRIAQGSLNIQGERAIAYENRDDRWERAIVDGAPARFQQTLDGGSLVHGTAASIEYLVAENTVILKGDATVIQENRGSFYGEKLTYNTDSGRIVGESGQDGQVHMTVQPKSVTSNPPTSSSPSE